LSPRLGVRKDISSDVSCTDGWVEGSGGSARAGLVVCKKSVAHTSWERARYHGHANERILPGEMISNH
jgi:hypothetical protein